MSPVLPVVGPGARSSRDAAGGGRGRGHGVSAGQWPTLSLYQDPGCLRTNFTVNEFWPWFWRHWDTRRGTVHLPWGIAGLPGSDSGRPCIPRLLGKASPLNRGVQSLLQEDNVGIRNCLPVWVRTDPDARRNPEIPVALTGPPGCGLHCDLTRTVADRSGFYARLSILLGLPAVLPQWSRGGLFCDCCGTGHGWCFVPVPTSWDGIRRKQEAFRVLKSRAFTGGGYLHRC